MNDHPHTSDMTSSLRVRPDSSEYAVWHAGYVARVPDGDIVTVLRTAGEELVSALGAIPEDKAGDRKSTRLNSSHLRLSRMPSSA